LRKWIADDFRTPSGGDGCDALQLLDDIVGQNDLGRHQIFLQMRHRRGAGNGKDIGRATKQPGKRDLHRRSDGMLVEFASAVDAVRSSAEVQRGMAEQNAALPQDHRIEFRIGIHVGDIIIDDNDIFGDGVNIAARLEGIAEPGGICISDDAQRQVRGKVDIAFEDMGSQTLKNIAEPMRAWRVQLGRQGTPAAQQVSSANQAPVLALPDKPSIAVLAFQNMSGDPEQEYFADGMVEDIITALSKFKTLFVIARNSSFTYKGKAVDIKQAGRELGVHYVLEGSVRKAGGRVRITGQLIDAATGTHLWADRFEGALDDIFELQDNVTRSVVGAIAPRLIEASEAAAIRKPLERWDSYDHYLRALPLFYQGQGNLVLLIEAQKIFRKIISSDVRFAPAYAYLALSILQMKDLHNQSVAEDERTEALRFAEQGFLCRVTMKPFWLARLSSLRCWTVTSSEGARSRSEQRRLIRTARRLGMLGLQWIWFWVSWRLLSRGLPTS
jgi:TolB-like protein